MCMKHHLYFHIIMFNLKNHLRFSCVWSTTCAFHVFEAPPLLFMCLKHNPRFHTFFAGNSTCAFHVSDAPPVLPFVLYLKYHLWFSCVLSTTHFFHWYEAPPLLPNTFYLKNYLCLSCVWSTTCAYIQLYILILNLHLTYIGLQNLTLQCLIVVDTIGHWSMFVDPLGIILHRLLSPGGTIFPGSLDQDGTSTT